LRGSEDDSLSEDESDEVVGRERGEKRRKCDEEGTNDGGFPCTEGRNDPAQRNSEDG